MAGSVRNTAGTNNVPLHEESIRLLELIDNINSPPYYELGVEKAREAYLNARKTSAGPYDFTGTTKDMKVPSPDVKDGVPVRVYHPKNARADPVIFVFAHGGGQVLGSVDGHDVCCKSLADLCECIMVSVEYRLGPEHKSPAAMLDTECVLEWVKQNKTKIGGTDKSLVGVGGDSAGGKISALACHYVSDLNFQILIYPLVDQRCINPSFTEYADGPLLDTQIRKWFRTLQLPDEEGIDTNPRFSAIHHSRFDHLPPAIFIVAECDPLRDDSYVYSKKLTEAGVYNELLLVKGAIHGFFPSPGFYKDCCSKAYSAVAKFIKTQVYKDME